MSITIIHIYEMVVIFEVFLSCSIGWVDIDNIYCPCMGLFQNLESDVVVALQ